MPITEVLYLCDKHSISYAVFIIQKIKVVTFSSNSEEFLSAKQKEKMWILGNALLGSAL